MRKQIKNKQNIRVSNILQNTIFHSKLLSILILCTILAAVILALLPPLVLETIINNLADGISVSFSPALFYLGLIALSGLMDSARESLLILFGQKITRNLRHELCAKLSRMPADDLMKREPGATVSRFVGDVDTVESLFTSGIISMFTDVCKVTAIFSVILIKNRGLALLLLILMPLLFWFTRVVQKNMLKAQLKNRTALAKVSNHVPETIQNIRMIHTLGKERYMREKYDDFIQESYTAVEKTNFYDAVYSPIILILNAVVIAFVATLSATKLPALQTLFGMSVGTAVAVISYISKVFSPIESIGMEIQTIQSAVAGVHRINDFLSVPERWSTDKTITLEALKNTKAPCIEIQDADFGYDKEVSVIKNLSFTVETGEQVTIEGRTGAGKSTLFKLLLGLYKPDNGHIFIYGKDASSLPDSIKRGVFGYVEQKFCMVPGTVLQQITLFDDAICLEQAAKAAKTVGLHEVIAGLPQGYDTPCTPALFSQGQWQLLSIARAIATEPPILLLDEITANLDSDTEQAVLSALQKASQKRTVLSISHRLYLQNGGRLIHLTNDTVKQC